MPEPPQSDFALPDPDALREEQAGQGAAESPSGAGSGVESVLDRHRDRLMALDGVVMVGEGQDEVGRDAIVVGVKQHHQLKTLPPSLDGVRVVGMVIGEVDALAAPGGRKPTGGSTPPRTRSRR
jgi:hypothetical protein